MGAGQAHAAPAARTTLAGLWALVAVDLRQVSMAEGFRAALSVAVIVAANEVLQWPPLMEAALAALLTCLCDPGGPIRRRIPTILTFGVLGALVTVAFGVLRNAPLAAVIPLACAGIFCSSFARVHGQPAQVVGNLLTVVQVLGLTRSIGSVSEAAALGGTFLGGSLWAALLTLVIWRLHPYAPARRAVASVYQELARLVHDMCLVLRHEEPHETIWDRHAGEHRRIVRTSIEAARAAVLATWRAHGPVSGRASQTLIRLEAADQIFGVLIALSDLLASNPDPPTRAAADRMLRRIRPLLIVLAHAIVADEQAPRDRLERAVQAIATVPQASPLRPIAEVLAERLRVPITLAAPDGWRPGASPDPPLAPFWRRTLASIRDNLTWQSEVLRHALRNAVVAAPAFAITLNWPTAYGHWLTITMVMTMQPYVALTYVRALERIGGTILGGLIAAVVATLCTTPIAIAAALFPLAVIALSMRPASFGLFIMCLTPLVVLLSELGRPGESELTIAGMRALYAVIGGGLAVAAALLLWPSWEPGRVARDLRVALLAHGAYAAAEIAVLLGEAMPEQVDAARRAAGVASNNLEATLQRALLEPGRPSARLDVALTIDAALRRMAGRLTTMHLDARAGHDPALWHAWAAWIEDAARRVAEGAAALPARPKLPAGDPQAESLARIARQLETSASAMRRLEDEQVARHRVAA
jgi:uncharacterized membrane protein YccC